MHTSLNASTPDVLCIGQAVVDCVTRCRTTDPKTPLVSVAESITLSAGGDAVNESRALSSLGISTGIVCGLGKDPAGALIRQTLESDGVIVSGITEMNPPFSTPVANIFVESDGSRSSVNSKATKLPGYIPSSAAFARAKVISFASLFRAPLDDPEIIRSLILSAKAAGAVVCADTKLPTFRKLQLKELEEVLPLIDYIFPNEREAAFYAGADDLPELQAKSKVDNLPELQAKSKVDNLPELQTESGADDLPKLQAKSGPVSRKTLNSAINDNPDDYYSRIADVFLNYGVRHIVIKAGPDGCYAKDADGFFHIPALPVKAVNSTGAGDHFVAGFISGILKNESFYKCCQNGIALAAKKIAVP